MAHLHPIMLGEGAAVLLVLGPRVHGARADGQLSQREAIPVYILCPIRMTGAPLWPKVISRAGQRALAGSYGVATITPSRHRAVAAFARK